MCLLSTACLAPPCCFKAQWQLHVFLCSIWFSQYQNGEWKSRTNRELEEMSKGEYIVKWIKEQRINWLGHLERMEEDRMPRKIFTQEMEGTRRRGRPRKRWKEEVERDLKCWEWQDGESWWQTEKNGRTMFDRPKPTVGCSANGIRRRYDSHNTQQPFFYIILTAGLSNGSTVFNVNMSYIFVYNAGS